MYKISVGREIEQFNNIIFMEYSDNSREILLLPILVLSHLDTVTSLVQNGLFSEIHATKLLSLFGLAHHAIRVQEYDCVY